MTDTTPRAAQSSKVVVTLFESYGSGAGYVSEKVAQALGVPLHPQAFSSEEIEDDRLRLAELWQPAISMPADVEDVRDDEARCLETTQAYLEGLG